MTSPPTFRPPKAMYLSGGIILLGAILYFAFMAVDGIGLANVDGTAVVTGKAYRQAGATYTQEVIANRAHVVAQATPETYLLRLALSSGPAEGAASAELYEQVEAGDTVRVIYQRRRITGGVQIVSIAH